MTGHRRRSNLDFDTAVIKTARLIECCDGVDAMAPSPGRALMVKRVVEAAGKCQPAIEEAGLDFQQVFDAAAERVPA